MIYRLPARTHHSKLSALYGLLHWSKSSVLAILFATIHAKVKTFGETLDFQMKFAEIKETTLIEVETTVKREPIEKNPKDVKDQIFPLGKMGDK